MLQDMLSTCTAVYVLYQSYQSDLSPGIYVLPLSFFFYDLMFNTLTMDFKIHHIITSSFAVVGLMQPYEPETKVILSSAEWSTLVLNITPYLPKTYQTGLQLLFCILFFKFRIFDWYFMMQEYTFSTVQLIPIVGLYSLNLYWFVVICKKLAKPLKRIDLNIVNHYIVSYTMLANSILIYLWYPTLTFTKIMSVLLGISSFLYHNEIALHYYGIPTIQSTWILYDVTIFHIFQTGYMYQIQSRWSIASIYIHVMNLMYIYKFLPEDISSASMPSFGLDVVYLLYSNPSIELFTIALLIIYIHVINPFYDVSFVSTHLLVCWYIYTRANHLLQF